jgi:hypothetical protein
MILILYALTPSNGEFIWPIFLLCFCNHLKDHDPVRKKIVFRNKKRFRRYSLYVVHVTPSCPPAFFLAFQKGGLSHLFTVSRTKTLAPRNKLATSRTLSKCQLFFIIFKPNICFWGRLKTIQTKK